MEKESGQENASSPYVGPQPFERGQGNFFFGREREAEDLFSQVYAQGETVVYAASGAGKTSLLNAGLIPKLEAEGFKLFQPARFSEPIPASVNLKEISNPFVFNILRAWDKGKTNPQDLVHTSLSEFLGSVDTSDLVLIFDQVEELFEIFPERWEARKEFFQQLGKLLREYRQLRVVFSIRQDYVANLIRFGDVLPERMKTRFHLERLRKASALRAIVEPPKKLKEPKHFAEGVAENLVEDLLKVRVIGEDGRPIEVIGEVVEPVQLQVVCQRLWSKLGPQVTVITEDHRKQLGDVTEALSQFYVDSIKRVMEVSHVKEFKLRNFFGKRLITPAGGRAPIFAGKGGVAGIPQHAIDVLENLHLIRKEPRAGTDWYELNHDRFIEPIQKSNDAWLAERQPALEVRNRLQERTRKWLISHRAESELLDEVDLREAVRWIKSPEATEVGYTRRIKEFVKESQRRIERQAEAARSKAEQQEREAEIARQRVKEERRLAEVERQRAEAERRRAEAETLRAEQEHSAKQSLRFRTAAVAVLALFTAACLFVVYRQRKLSHSRELAAAAVNVSKIDADLSILLAREAYNTEPTDEAVQALQRAVLSSRTQYILKGHTGPVYGVAFSPDNKWLATAGTDFTARIWDMSAPPGSSTESYELSEHSGPVLGVAFSRDGQRLATASWDGKAKLWDISDLRPDPNVKERKKQSLLTFDDGQHKGVTGVAFSPDGTHLLTSSFDGTAKIWNISSPLESPTILKGHQDAVIGVAYNQDGTRIVTSSLDGTAKLWDSAGNEVLTLGGPTGHTGPVYSAVFSPDGKYIATSGLDQTAKIWDAATGENLSTLTGHSAMLGVVAFDPSGHLLATASADGTAKLWDVQDVKNYKELLTLTGHNSLIFGVAFSRDGKRLATASWDGTARVWNIAGGLDLIGHTDEIKAISYSGDGKYLASGSTDGTARVWDAASGEEVRIIRYINLDKNVPVYALAFSPEKERHLLAIGCLDGTAQVWDIDRPDTETPLFPLKHGGAIYGIAYSRDGKYLATASADKTARVWDASTGKLLQTITHQDLVFGVAFSPDGERLATACADFAARVWDWSSGKELFHSPLPNEPRAKEGHTGWIKAVGFSPDGKLLVTASSDRTVKVWKASGNEAGKYVLTLTGRNNSHNSAVNGVAFGEYKKKKFFGLLEHSVMAVATASSDGTVKIWDVLSNELLSTLSGHGGPVNCIAFSPNGPYLASAGVDRSIHLNVLNVEKLQEFAQPKVVRSFTQDECRKYQAFCPPG